MPGSLLDLLDKRRAAERRFAPGESVFRQGDEVVVLHQVVEGRIHLVRHQPGGTALILQRAGARSVLAEASIFSGRYHCDAVAMGFTRTRAFDRAELRRAMAADGRLADAWAAYLAGEVQATRLRAEILSLRTVAARLDAWIAAHDGGFPERGDWKTVATEIGTSPEALYREIAKRRLARSRWRRTSPLRLRRRGTG